MQCTDSLGDMTLTDLLTGRSLALALAPGLDPLLGTAQLAELSHGDRSSLLDARTRLRRGLQDGPGNPTLQLAIDLLDEAAVELTTEPAAG